MPVVDDLLLEISPEYHKPISRYMDFAKFVSMLEIDGGSLFFARADKLGDCFEGFAPNDIMEEESRLLDRALSEQPEMAPGISRCWEILKSVPFHVGVSCWHCDEDESAALWKIYGGSRGIAIRSTVERLVGALDVASEEVRVGLVGYVGGKQWSAYEEERSGPPYYERIFAKRRCFKYEHELRAVIGDVHSSLPFPENGKFIPISLSSLIEKIVIMPDAPSWYLDLVKRVCTRYKLQVDVVESDLAERPVWGSTEHGKP